MQVFAKKANRVEEGVSEGGFFAMVNSNIVQARDLTKSGDFTHAKKLVRKALEISLSENSIP